jgi:hypothetical protein
MFKKVLIANRGEIAVRVIQACRELGLETVAIFSEPDKDGKHVQMASERWRLEGQPAKVYLDGTQILDIAKRLPDLARATQSTLQSQGNSHPIIDQIVTLIDQRCNLTIRRLAAPHGELPPTEAA